MVLVLDVLNTLMASSCIFFVQTCNAAIDVFLSHYLATVVKWLKLIKLKLNPNKVKVVMLRIPDVLEGFMLPTFDEL